MKIHCCHDYGKETSIVNDTIATSVPSNIKERYSKKKVLGIIIVLIVFIISAPFLFNIIYELVYPVAAITDVSVTYDNAVNGTYYAYFRLRNTGHLCTSSDGIVKLEITRNDVILYDKTFTVYKSQFKKGTAWPFYGSFTYYGWTFPASDVPGLPAPLTEFEKDRPSNVMASITFTTPQGKTFTDTDDVFPYVDL